MSEPLFDEPPANRTLRSYVTPQEQISGAVTLALVNSGHLTSDALRAMLVECRTPAEKMAVLAGERPDGLSSLWGATVLEMPLAVSAFCEAITQESLAGEFTNAQVYELITHGRGVFDQPFNHALCFGGTEMVRPYLEMFERVLTNGAWTAQQKMEMLTAPSPKGETALFSAGTSRNAEGVRLYCEMLVRLLAAGHLTGEQFHEVLSCRSPDGSAIRGSVAYQDALSILMIGEFIAKGAATGQLSSEAVSELINGKRANGPSVFDRAMLPGSIASIQPFCELLKNMWSTGILSREQVFEILSGTRADGEPAFYMALRKCPPETVLAFGDGLRNLYDAGALTRDQVETLLEAKASSGEIGVVNAQSVRGQEATVQAFWAVVVEAMADGRVSAEKVREWAIPR